MLWDLSEFLDIKEFLYRYCELTSHLSFASVLVLQVSNTY